MHIRVGKTVLPGLLLILTGCSGGQNTFVSPASPSAVSSARVSLSSPTTRQISSTCQVDVIGEPESVAGAGGSFTVVVHASADCHWTVEGSSGVAASPRSGRGDGQVSVSIEGNPDPERNLSLNINGHVLHVRQPNGCSYRFDRNAITVGADGGPVTLVLTTLPGCAWRASASEHWIDVKEAHGEGGWDLPFHIDQNFGGERHAFLTIANQIVPITQAGRP